MSQCLSDDGMRRARKDAIKTELKRYSYSQTLQEEGRDRRRLTAHTRPRCLIAARSTLRQTRATDGSLFRPLASCIRSSARVVGHACG